MADCSTASIASSGPRCWCTPSPPLRAMLRNLVVLGSTGSIGRQTLDVAREMPDRIHVYGLAASSSADRLRSQVEEFRPDVACLTHGSIDLGGTETLIGEAGLLEMVSRPEVDLVVMATTGKAGLAPTLAAIEAGKLVGLANKE